MEAFAVGFWGVLGVGTGLLVVGAVMTLASLLASIGREL